MHSSAGIIAILRGLAPCDAEPVGAALYESGVRMIEVPLNSPEPLTSISLLRDLLPADCRVGAGTVLTPLQVADVRAAGADLVVSPNADVDVIRATVAAEMESYPGVATATEAFLALSAGATALKIFPASTVGIDGMQAWQSVLPTGTELYPVGGVSDANLAQWLRAGASGAGIGGSLYRAGDDSQEVAARAIELMRIWDEHLAGALE